MSTTQFTTQADDILSRSAYLAAYSSKNNYTFSQYREHVLAALIRPYEDCLFPTQLDALRERFQVSLQELVNATPNDIHVLESDNDNLVGKPMMTLEEQRELVQRKHFETTFERLRENIQMVVKCQQRYLRRLYTPVKSLEKRNSEF
ncbi:hypothetical protein G9A89_012628 [Geosiphon pyriformis]|nr:hypothetical protein G9A89_012628 [Geosiphon pyriformis]